MKVTLISPYPDVTVFGLRVLSAVLRKHGHSTQMIFLPDPFGDSPMDGVPRYPDAVLDQAADLCRSSDLIGISAMTNFFDGAVQINAKLKSRLKVPVIWGGVHPTIRPEECLEHADLVCVGEADESLLELVDKMSRGEDYTTTPNLCFKRNGAIVRNPLSPLPADLDAFPFPDYSMSDHHVLRGNLVVPLTHEVLKEFLGRGSVSARLGKTGYQTMTSRGCPYACTYCINDTIRSMYGGKGKLRWRSVPNVIEELGRVRREMSYVDYIWLSDDEFMARKMEEIQEFCRLYKEKIHLPFSCLISPMSVTEDKMSILVDAGLVYVQMGIESGSARMQALFNRKHINNERMMNAIRVINTFRERMYPPSYDFLMDVPGETEADRIDSLRFISDIPKPYRLQPFTVILYPGCKLYTIAKEQGLIQDERREIYNKTYTMRTPDYLNLLMSVSKGGKMPGGLLKILISRPVVGILNSGAFRPLIRTLYGAMKGVRRIFSRGQGRP